MKFKMAAMDQLHSFLWAQIKFYNYIPHDMEMCRWISSGSIDRFGTLEYFLTLDKANVIMLWKCLTVMTNAAISLINVTNGLPILTKIDYDNMRNIHWN